MKLLYARLTGPIASFRYPFIVTGRQPSYPLPPLSTIYGLLCAAWGSEYDEVDLRVGYLFHAETETTDDIEKLWLLKRRTESFVGPESRTRRTDRPVSPIEEMKSNIIRRELYVNVSLELYLWAGEEMLSRWLSALRSPRFWVTLGRSQELVSIEEVQFISTCTEIPSPLYGGPGLYPLSWRQYVKGAYTTEKMPVYIPTPERRPVFHGLFLQLLTPQPMDEQQLLPRLTSDEPRRFIIVPTRVTQPSQAAPQCRLIYLWPLGKAALSSPDYFGE